ncbi:MAG: helix-turn-helix domain-containing protein [Candidatus Spyradocola sp.]|nr:helix-turn-helix domain-containing protein [Candidatus Spyradocola sp.]
MDWVERMNGVMDYLEAHLCEPIDTEEISRIMAWPYSAFQRSFAPITGISLSEYLRRRRLTLAAYDLQHTDMRVLDVAVKYGYDSADAFAAAFKRLHGVTPQEARQPGVPLKFCARMKFTFAIVGVEEMDYSVVNRAAFSVLGVRRVTPQPAGAWGIVKADDTRERLLELTGKPCELGLCFGFLEDGSNDYMCGAEYAGAEDWGYDRFTYPETTFLTFTAKGTISDGGLWKTWQRIYGEFLPQSEYRQLDLPTIERYVVWDEERDDMLVEINIPVEKMRRDEA